MSRTLCVKYEYYCEARLPGSVQQSQLPKSHRRGSYPARDEKNGLAWSFGSR